MNKCISVLGMHRSGTSALTGTLNLMGVHLGSELMPAYADNPKGFFENEKISRLNQKLLESCNSTWEDSFLYGAHWHRDKDLDEYREIIKRLITDEFEAIELFAIKDPRMCILFPFWNSIFESLNINVVCILCLRHPFEVAASLKKRNNFSIENGLVLWMNYMLSAEHATRAHSRVFILYDDLLKYPEKKIQIIAEKLNLSFPKKWRETENEITAFLDRRLKHHFFDDQLKQSDIVKMVADYFQILKEITSDPNQDKAHWKKVDDIRKHYTDLYHFFYNKNVQVFAKLPSLLKAKDKIIQKLKRKEAAINFLPIKLRMTGGRHFQSLGNEVWVLDIYDKDGYSIADWESMRPESPWRIVDADQNTGTKALIVAEPAEIDLNLPPDGKLRLLKHPWSGIIEIEYEGDVEKIDLYSPDHYFFIFQVRRKDDAFQAHDFGKEKDAQLHKDSLS